MVSYRLVNLNPHEVVLIGDGQQLVLPPSGTVPRLVLGGGTTVTVGALGAGDGAEGGEAVAEGPGKGTGDEAEGAADGAGGTGRAVAEGGIQRAAGAAGAGGAASVADVAGAAGTGEETPVTLSLTYGEGLVGLDPPLPDPQPGVLYVTSRVVAEHCPQRDDLAWPHELVRDTAGRPVGARGLATVGPPPGQSGRKSLP